MRVLTKLVNISCRGELPEFVSQALCSASLSAWLKKKGGFCRIAVGEVLGRLIAKCLAKEANLEAKELFQSLQLGVGVKGGAEAITHYRLRFRITKYILISSSSSGNLQIDFCNAFNSIKRSEIMKTVSSSMPSIAAFTNSCYSQHSQLFYDKFVVSSESGIQQGDPLGPLLFSLTLWPILEKIQEISPELQKHSWYLDDGVLVGSEDDLIRSWDLLCQLGPDRGLHLKVDKCELSSTVDLDRLDIRIKRNDISGPEVLGAALGTPEFVCMKFNERIAKIRVLFDKLDYLDDPQCALDILRHCIRSPKTVYSVHCQTPASPVIKSLKEFDAQQQEKLENILGTVLPEESRTQATLLITLSELGVRQCQDQYKASYFGSVLSSEDLVSKITSESPKNCQVFRDLYSSIAQLDISNLSQKTIQHALDNEKFHGLKENLACERESARLLSLSVRHAGAWLSAPPIPALGLHMAPNEFTISAKYRLGVPVYDAERKCPFCKAGFLDINGDHAIACHGRGDAIARHDRIRDKIVSACSFANLSPVVEKKLNSRKPFTPRRHLCPDLERGETCCI